MTVRPGSDAIDVPVKVNGDKVHSDKVYSDDVEHDIAVKAVRGGLVCGVRLCRTPHGRSRPKLIRAG
ncbi:hypothetical protein P1P68_25660 [Streptomyces scabiei]|uniref:hypothetical protein n=1 Tax=Streptomyces scabiei TaxID=1930 RepID=UPI00298FF5EF|nr:hypothetical protein [Streptomyces scabiei]MDW8808078.1 hypothetical protein [Streptomyces scabiei]